MGVEGGGQRWGVISMHESMHTTRVFMSDYKYGVKNFCKQNLCTILASYVHGLHWSSSLNSLNAKCIYTYMRELSASPFMQCCVLCCVDQNDYCRCMEVQYCHACNPITSHTSMWSWCKHILCAIITCWHLGVNKYDILH